MIGILAGLALGLGGSLHCAGMCGPIAVALPSGTRPGWPRHVTEKFIYQLGRVTTYMSLGAIVGLSGSAVVLAGYSRVLSIVSGLAMIVALAAQFLWRREVRVNMRLDRAVIPIKRGLSRLFTHHGTLTHFGIGLLNGLLPCGMVTAALLGSLGMGSMIQGAVFMLGFGLGTVPLMSAIAIGGSRMSCEVRQRLRYAAPAIGLVIATLFLLRGMELGIPYVSPIAVKTNTLSIEHCR
ncbi:MAG: sulfite exporter TauE/SafE family protein [Bacteroidota bacterium]|nr:sulfite exporter TauE/SafE family protein [Bacteroidota bacterium]MDP4232424.1 sulfite exporter TauE/SafE family protein [Bacteroidota bacterium]MDP4241560.1 sulfite exporter TauE/SafE family protein [Bacteroidota bacterium]MDP4286304.1 sulfite exporter TauE/SafE family protein [Bacteroidota bacterium]